jgi:hypothetical protein
MINSKISSKIVLTQGMVYVLILLIKVSLFSSCGLKEKVSTLTNQKNSKENSNSRDNSVKIDTMRYYYPVVMKEEGVVTTYADTSMLSTLSGSLLMAKEPAIYSFNNEHDVYRLLIFKASGPVEIISLHKEGDNVWYTAKTLSRAAFLKPQPGGRFLPVLNYDGTIDSSRNVSYDEYETISQMMPGKPELTAINEKFSKDTWDNMEYLIKQADFWKMPAYLNLDRRGNDHWILEARINNKYWLVDKIDAGGDFRKCCDYLVELKKFKGENNRLDGD